MAVFRCRLSDKIQLELLNNFVLEVTARSAANIVGILPHSAALFYKKIRTVISEHLEEESKELFNGQIELDNSVRDILYLCRLLAVESDR